MFMSDNYYRSVAEVAKLPPQYEAMKYRSINRLLDLGKNVAERNRATRDAYLILLGDWKEEKEWPFTGILELEEQTRTIQPPSSLSDPELWKRVTSAVEERAKKTPRSFEELQEKFPAPEDIGDYFEWFYTYIPYLTLGLDAASEQDWRKALERMRWMLNQSPEQEVFESLEDEALSYLIQWTRVDPVEEAA